MILLALTLFVFCVLIAVGESYYEREWPRDTGKFAVFSFLLLIFSISVFV